MKTHIGKTILALLFIIATMGVNATNPIAPKQPTVLTNTGVNTIHLTTEQFKQKVFNYEANKEWKYEGTLPCIIDFYTTWCGPCKMIAPILEDLAAEYAGKIIVYKIDTEKEPELSAAFGIRSIPTLLFIPANGQPQLAQGAMAKEQFKEAIEQVLLKK